MNHTVKKYINTHNLIKKGDHILIAFSGGPDSMYLLFILTELREQYELKLGAVHINHGLLEDADEQEEFARQICKEYQVEFYSFQIDIKTYARQEKLSVEEAGRKFRYQKFYEVKETEGYDQIAVAHHRDDQAETVLYRLARGTGWKGIAGIRSRQKDIIRPLLGMTKQQILQELSKRKASFNVDPSNQEVHYARNRVRHLVLPELEQINTKAKEHIAQLAEQMEEIGAYLEGEIQKAMGNIVSYRNGSCQISISGLQTYPHFLQTEVLKKCLQMVAEKERDLERVHVEQILDLIKKQTGKKLDLPYQMEALRQYETIVISQKKEIEKETIFVETEGTYDVNFANGRMKIEILKNEKEISQNIYTRSFDYDKIKKSITIRIYQLGDFFILNEKGQRKKVNRYYIDQKIPSDIRQRIPIVACGEHALWIVGHRSTKEFEVTKNTKKVLRMTWVPMEEDRWNIKLMF